MNARARRGAVWMLLQRFRHMRPEDQQAFLGDKPESTLTAIARRLAGFKKNEDLFLPMAELLPSSDPQTVAKLGEDLAITKKLFRSFDEINLRTETFDQLGDAERSEESEQDEMYYEPWEYFSTGSAESGLGGGGGSQGESAMKVVLDALGQFNPLGLKKADI